jgi:hypothetical protein
MSSGDDGLLGNLPRRRPGTRSAKRDQAPRGATARPGPTRAAPADAEPRQPDAVGDVLRAAAGAAEAGARIAQDVAREVLRRLPRP